LSAIALGDGKLHSVYKRANVSEHVGDNAVEDLVEKKIIKIAKAKKGDDRLYFTTPFLRFWFAFVSPLFKGVRDGDYSEVKERWENKRSEFFSEVFSRLSREVVKKQLKELQIMKLSSYIQNDTMLDIYLKTKDKKVFVGVVKYTNSKVKKSLLTQLEQTAKELGVEPDGYIIVSKSGFSSELKSLKKKTPLTLLTLKHFKTLLEDIS